eukprot:GHUV01002270.1.p1 GENE.GHUV01002270.1~~GHUV01002270.1.p1  ORF type:complete len:347 (+),score=121.21 GHUV01002270.1:142-1182(+)
MAVQDMRKQLEKKATFESAVKSLRAQLQQPTTSEADLGELLDCCNRVNTLLKARYSSISFWNAGLDLYKAAAGVASATPALRSHIPKLNGYIAAAEAFLAGDTEEPAAARLQTLGELLLGLPPPQESSSHLSDAGLVLQHTGPAVSPPDVPLQQPPATEADAAVSVDDLVQRLQNHRAQEQQQGHEQAEPQHDEQQQREALLLETLAGQLPRAELEALLARLTEDAAAHQAPTKPPASKQAVATLPVLHLKDQAALDSIGSKGTACPVCTEELQLGDRVQQLPCKHVFHVPCLAPWLRQNNSCPVCRHELPTDDWKYEARKEREAEEEEARQGAAAALSHNEFMYV